MVVLVVALVPTIGFGSEGGEKVTRRTTSSSMESVFVEVENTDTTRRTIRVYALGVASDTPAADVRLLPGDSADLEAGETKRVLAVFQNLQPGERREARICHAPVNRPSDKRCEQVSIDRT